jgi:uridine monophosphate synthetase
MADFFATLTQVATEMDSLLCVGLDPHPALLPEPTAAAARDFCLALITQCAPYACAFKPNSAFFEVHGPAGIEALQDVIAAVRDGHLAILDAKRGDIASTAKAYAQTVYDTLGADAVTVSPYLGSDALAPFLDRPDHGVFVLCKTSNPGAGEFQDLTVAPGPAEPLYLRVARQAQEWGDRSGIDNVGLVVGATDPKALARVRAAAPALWFLAPGVGAQGGDLQAALSAGLRADGLGLLVTVSRSLAQASDPAAAAVELRDTINRLRRLPPATDHTQVRPARGARGPATARSGSIRTARSEASAEGDLSANPAAPVTLEALADALLQSGCVRFGHFTLKSGRHSPIYLDLRQLASHPSALRTVAAAFRARLDDLSFDRLAAVPYAGLPIGTAIALATDWPLIYPRREAKGYGTRATVEGDFAPNQTAVVIDDLITTGRSKVETITRLREAGLRVRDVVVLIDRRPDPITELDGDGIRIHAVVTLRELLDIWLRGGAITDTEYREVNSYLGGGDMEGEEG